MELFHSTLCHLVFYWAGLIEQNMLIKVHFQPLKIPDRKRLYWVSNKEGRWSREIQSHSRSLAVLEEKITVLIRIYLMHPTMTQVKGY